MGGYHMFWPALTILVRRLQAFFKHLIALFHAQSISHFFIFYLFTNHGMNPIHQFYL